MFFNFHLIMYEYVNIAIGMNVTVGWGILIAQHKMCTNLSRPSTLPKKKERARLGQGYGWQGKAMV